MAKRRPIVAGNWKMHGTTSQAAALISALRGRISASRGPEVIVAPPYTALETAARALVGSEIRLAGQNLHPEAKGAFTGEVSGVMLKEVGCSHVILGHSERRQLCGETDELVGIKVQAAHRDGLIPIICVGETLEQRDRGETITVVDRQIRAALHQAESGAAVIAYEPVWAIGTGRTASPEDAQRVHVAIRGVLAELMGDDAANAVRILYGGSVKPDNVDPLMAQPDIDGALVGGASLDADAFARIVHFR